MPSKKNILTLSDSDTSIGSINENMMNNYLNMNQRRTRMNKKKSFNDIKIDDELEKMLKDKRKRDIELKKVMDTQSKLNENFKKQIKEDLDNQETIETNLSIDKVYSESFLPQGMITFFHTTLSDSKLSWPPLKILSENNNIWNQFREIIDSANFSTLYDIISGRLVLRIIQFHNVICPIDITQWLIEHAIKENSNGLAFHSLVNIACLLFHNPDLIIKSSIHSFLDSIDHKFNHKMPIKFFTTWKPNTTFFIELLEWSGFSLHNMRLVIYYNHDYLNKDIEVGLAQGELSNIFLLLEICLKSNRFEFEKKNNIQELLISLLLLELDPVMLHSKSIQNHNVLPEFIEAIPANIWDTEFLEKLTKNLILIVNNCNREKYLVYSSDPKSDVTLDVINMILIILHSLPSKRSKCFTLKNYILLYITPQFPFLTVNLDHPPDISVYELDIIKTAHKLSSALYIFVENKTYGLNAVELRFLAVSIKMMDMLLYQNSQSLNISTKLFDEIYLMLERIFYRLPKQSLYSALLSYVSEAFVIFFEQNKRKLSIHSLKNDTLGLKSYFQPA